MDQTCWSQRGGRLGAQRRTRIRPASYAPGSMDWIGEPEVTGNTVERAFEMAVDGRTVPGILWRPDAAPPPQGRPLVLIGHGATLHKRVDYIVHLAQLLVDRGFAAAALDAPGHGDRRADTSADEVQLFAN